MIWVVQFVEIKQMRRLGVFMLKLIFYMKGFRKFLSFLLNSRRLFPQQLPA